MPHQKIDLLTLSIILLFIPSIANAQIDQEKLDNLRGKYPWGSIYVTYSSIINLSSILKDDKRTPRLEQQYSTTAMSTLNQFLQGFRNRPSNENISFIEIDLNRIEAGYKRANDVGGEITSIAWSKENVVNIADICDRQLIVLVNLKRTLSLMSNDSISIQLAYDNLNLLKSNLLLSDEAYFLAASEFQLLMVKKDYNDIANLDIKIRSDIAAFLKDYDNKYMQLKDFKLSNDNIKNKNANLFLQNMAGLEKNLYPNPRTTSLGDTVNF